MIISTIDQIREYFPDIVGDSNAYDNIKPFLQDYEDKLKEELGDATFALADPPEAGEGEEPTEPDAILLALFRAYIVYMAYYARSPLMNVTFGEDGMQVHWSDTHRPATEQQRKSAQYALLSLAAKKFEAIIKYLNKTKPAVWTSSDNFKLQNRLLFKDSTTFCRYLNIENSVRLYWLMSASIFRQQQLQIEPILTAAWLNEIRTKVHAGTALTADEEIMLDHSLSFLANKCMSEIIITISEEDLPVSMLPMDKDTRGALNLRYAENAKTDLALLQKKVSDLATPEEAPHTNVPDNTDTTRKTFRL